MAIRPSSGYATCGEQMGKGVGPFSPLTEPYLVVPTVRLADGHCTEQSAVAEFVLSDAAVWEPSRRKRGMEVSREQNALPKHRMDEALSRA